MILLIACLLTMPSVLDTSPVIGNWYDQHQALQYLINNHPQLGDVCRPPVSRNFKLPPRIVLKANGTGHINGPDFIPNFPPNFPSGKLSWKFIDRDKVLITLEGNETLKLSIESNDKLQWVVDRDTNFVLNLQREPIFK